MASTDVAVKSKQRLIAIDKAYLNIDFRNKTVFLDERGRDITYNILSYQEGERIIEDAINEELP
ncbi:MAG: hypothetical protein AAB681_01015 [Patescibacteria group bacterium]